MSISVTCECGARFRVKDENAGKRGRCPKCARTITITPNTPPPPPPQVVPPVGPMATAVPQRDSSEFAKEENRPSSGTGSHPVPPIVEATPHRGHSRWPIFAAVAVTIPVLIVIAYVVGRMGVKDVDKHDGVVTNLDNPSIKQAIEDAQRSAKRDESSARRTQDELSAELNEAIRGLPISSSGSTTQADDDSVAKLREVLHDDDVTTRVTAIRQWTETLARYKTGTSSFRAAAQPLLQAVDGEEDLLAEPIAELLADGKRHEQLGAVRILYTLGPAADFATADLLHTYWDGDAELAEEANRTLDQLYPQVRDDIALSMILLKLCRQESGFSREGASEWRKATPEHKVVLLQKLVDLALAEEDETAFRRYVGAITRLDSRGVVSAIETLRDKSTPASKDDKKSTTPSAHLPEWERLYENREWTDRAGSKLRNRLFRREFEGPEKDFVWLGYLNYDYVEYKQAEDNLVGQPVHHLAKFNLRDFSEADRDFLGAIVSRTGETSDDAAECVKEVELNLLGTVVLAEPPYREVSGTIRKILDDQTVVIDIHHEDGSETAMTYAPGQVREVFRMHDAEFRRRPALFRDRDVCWLRYDATTKRLVGEARAVTEGDTVNPSVIALVWGFNRQGQTTDIPTKIKRTNVPSDEHWSCAQGRKSVHANDVVALWRRLGDRDLTGARSTWTADWAKAYATSGPERSSTSTTPLLKDFPRPGEITNSVGIKLRLVPSGKAEVTTNTVGQATALGLFASPLRKDKVKLIRRDVDFDSSFYMGAYEVTREQFDRVMGTAGTKRRKAAGEREGVVGFPVHTVTWHEAVAFCWKLSQMPEERAERRVYRLPTCAEWEYAYRAGTKTPYFFGNPKSYAEYANAFAPPKPASSNSLKTVGTLKPNPLGLYDMDGNVSEWCSTRDLRGYEMMRSSKRCIRGSDFTFGLSIAQMPAYMVQVASPTDQGFNIDNFLGFRVVCYSLKLEQRDPLERDEPWAKRWARVKPETRRPLLDQLYDAWKDIVRMHTGKDDPETMRKALSDVRRIVGSAWRGSDAGTSAEAYKPKPRSPTKREGKTVIIRSQVIDRQGKPIDGVTTEILSQYKHFSAFPFSQKMTTNARGEYQFEVPRDHHVTLFIQGKKVWDGDIDSSLPPSRITLK